MTDAEGKGGGEALEGAIEWFVAGSPPLEREVERRVERKIADMRHEELLDLLESTVGRLDRIADRMEQNLLGEERTDV